MLLSAVLAQGCAVGYGVGTTSAHVGTAMDVPQAQTWSTTYQEFRLIDTTGLALAAIVNAGRQYNARNEAMEEANRQAAVAQPGETVRVEYSWEPMPILAGLLTDVRIRVPLATAGLELDGVDSMQDVEYWAFNVRPEFYTFRPLKSLPMVSSLYLSVDVENWKSHQPMQPLLTEHDVVSLDMDFGASTSYVVGENMTATGRVAIGTLSPLLGLLTPGSSKLNPSIEAEFGYRPWHSDKMGVVVSGLAYLGREFVIGTDGRSMWSPRIGLNVALTFGNQVPKKVREARPAQETQPPAGAAAGTSSGTTAGSGSISGNVCLGDSPAPECAQVANKAPERVKVLWLACVQSTMKVAETKQLGNQPHDCRVAGDGIANLIKTGPGQPITADDQRLMRVAAAGAYDLSAAGYESMEKLGKDHCASVEATFNFVVGPDANNPVLPAKVKVVDDAVTQCRQKYTCTADAAGVVACQDKAAPVPASAPTPATPAPTTPAPATPAPASAPAPAATAPATPAPGTPAPATPAPGTPAPATTPKQ